MREALHLCPPDRIQPTAKPAPRPRDRSGDAQRRNKYVRGDRLPRDEYLAQHRTTKEQKLVLQRARQARYRARRRAAAGE